LSDYFYSSTSTQVDFCCYFLL